MGKQSATQDIGNVVDAYRKAYGTIQGEKRALDDYYTDKLGMINAIIDPNDKDLVSDVKKEFDDKINSWRDQLKTLNGIGPGSIASADENCKNAQKDRDEKGEKYDELKGKQKSIEEELKKLKDLKLSIEMEEDKEGTFKNVNMYFLISDMDDKLTEIKNKIMSVESLEKGLYQAWMDLDTAKEYLKTKEAELKERKDERDQIKKELEEAEKTRKEEILDEIHIRRTLLPESQTLQESQTLKKGE